MKWWALKSLLLSINACLHVLKYDYGFLTQYPYKNDIEGEKSANS